MLYMYSKENLIWFCIIPYDSFTHFQASYEKIYLTSHIYTKKLQKCQATCKKRFRSHLPTSRTKCIFLGQTCWARGYPFERLHETKYLYLSNVYIETCTHENIRSFKCIYSQSVNMDSLINDLRYYDYTIHIHIFKELLSFCI